MRVCILTWNKTGIQNGFCRQQLLKAWGDWQLEFRRGLCKSVDGQEELGSGRIFDSARGLSEFSISTKYIYKICLAVVPLNKENGKWMVTFKAMPVLTWSIPASDFRLGDPLAYSYGLSLPVG